ncbi:MAG: helix-turn-helix transcriptional regulator [Tabrizicola sp.]|nr:helix-turn-helix transcriptional regulator [Tabrizicola sp.]
METQVVPEFSPDTDCLPDCPIAAAGEVLSGKWTTLIFRDLFGGTRRYSQLQASLAGISPRILADRLRMLEEKGLVHRRVIPSVPPKTEYSLTEKGRLIEPVLAALAGFGQRMQGIDGKS